MLKETVRETSRADAASRLEAIAQGLRSGTIAVQTKKVAVSDSVELTTEAKDGELKIEFKWEPLRM